MRLWSFSLSKTTFALPAAASPLLSYLSWFWNSKANCRVCPDLKQPWVLEIETFLNAEIIYLPETGPQSADSSLYNGAVLPVIRQQRGLWSHLCPPVLCSDHYLKKNVLPLSTCELLPFLAPASGSESTLAFFLETDSKYASQLTSGGECWKSFSSDAATKDCHEHLRRAERATYELKPRVLSEYILMHFQPLTRVHKAIKAATDKRTCRKVIKCKVLWRTAELQRLLQGHALIYCLTGWWAREEGGYWPPSVREITAFSWKQPLYEWDIWQKGEWPQILPEQQIAGEIQYMKMSEAGQGLERGMHFMSEYWTNQEKATFNTAGHEKLL